jgi:hypothetical protein
VAARSPKRIHIVGVSPRTGTTLLAECMVACLNIDAFETHETPVWRLRLGAQVYLTKRPADLYAIAPRLRRDPDFHVVCLMRDPRDVVVSRHAQDPGRYWSSLRIWKQRLLIMRAFSDHRRFHILRYEELVADPDVVARRLVDWLPFLELVRPFSAFPATAAPSAKALEALGPVRPFDTSGIGNWKRHLPRIAGQLSLHGPITAELIEFGYERDAAWLTLLDGVTPDVSPSRHGDGARSSLRRRLERTILPWVSAGVVRLGRAMGVKIA